MSRLDWMALGGLVTLAVLNYLDERRAWAEVERQGAELQAWVDSTRRMYGSGPR